MPTRRTAKLQEPEPKPHWQLEARTVGGPFDLRRLLHMSDPGRQRQWLAERAVYLEALASEPAKPPRRRGAGDAVNVRG